MGCLFLFSGEEMELKNLLTERRNAASQTIDRLSTVDMLAVMNREDVSVAESVRLVLPNIAKALDLIVSACQKGGRLFYTGAGTSGRLGVLDASECPPTFGVSPELVQGIIAGGEAALSRATEATEDDPASGARDLLDRGFRTGDVLCGIAASGRTPYVLGAVNEARRMGAKTIGLSCVPDSDLAQSVDVAIAPLTGPEVITGSTRMKAGTATKLVLNMLSTGMMIRLGMTFGNLMVNVQPKNEKLKDRSRRIVMEICGCTNERASELLQESANSVRTAIVMGKLQVSRTEAENKLKEAGNVVARALGDNQENG